jgi:hypothetical protein
MFESTWRKGFAHFSSSILRMSISDEENKELDNQEDMYELGAAEEQNEAGMARILEQISRSPEDEQMEDDVENNNDESVDESAETELLYGEWNCENFGDMLGHVQMIIENLLRKKADIDTLLDRLHGYRNVYKIENLVKGFY